MPNRPPLAAINPPFANTSGAYRRFGEAALKDERGGSWRVWKRIPEEIRDQVLEMALGVLQRG